MLILRRPWTEQPQEAIEPRASFTPSGLWIPAYGTRLWTPSGWKDPGVNTAVLTASRAGLARAGNASSTYLDWVIATPVVFPTLWLAVYFANDSPSTVRSAVALGEDTGNANLYSGIGTYTSAKVSSWGRLTVSGADAAIDAATIVAGTVYAVARISRSATDHVMWVNGLRATSSTSTGAPSATTWGHFTIGTCARGVAAPIFYGSQQVALAGYAVTDPGDAWLSGFSLDPWGTVFEPRRILVPVAAAAAGGANADLAATGGSGTLAASAFSSAVVSLAATGGSGTLSATASSPATATLGATGGSGTLSASASSGANADLAATGSSGTLAAVAYTPASVALDATGGSGTFSGTAAGVDATPEIVGGGGWAWQAPAGKKRYDYLSQPTREQMVDRVRRQREALGILPKQARKRIEAAAKKEARRAEPSLAPLAPLAAEVAQDTGVALQAVIDAIQASFEHQRGLVVARMLADAERNFESQRLAAELARVEEEAAQRAFQQRLPALLAADEEMLRLDDEARQQAIETIRQTQRALLALIAQA